MRLKCADSQFRMIILLGDMADDQVLQPLALHRGQQLRRLVVVQMTMHTPDPPLEWPWIRTALKHLDIVVEFQQERITVRVTFRDIRGNVSQVGQHPDPAATRGDNVLTGLPGIVGNGNRFNAQRTDPETAMTIDRLPTGHIAGTSTSIGAGRHIDRNVEFAREWRDAVNMIRVFMRDQDSVYVLRLPSQPTQPDDRLLDREAKIDENAGVLILNDGRIATTATAEGSDSHFRWNTV